MISTIISSLRALKGLYDLIFSDKKFYVDSRAELKNGVGHSIEQFKEGYNNPRPASEKPALIRKPFKIILMILIAVSFAAGIKSAGHLRTFQRVSLQPHHSHARQPTVVGGRIPNWSAIWGIKLKLFQLR